MTRSLRVAVQMDPIESINIDGDSTFALMLEAQRRGHALRYLRQGDLEVRDGTAWARLAPVEVRDDTTDWFTLGEARWQPLADEPVAPAQQADHEPPS